MIKSLVIVVVRCARNTVGEIMPLSTCHLPPAGLPTFRALDLIHMTMIATVRLHELIRVQAVSKYIIEYGNVVVLPSRIWSVDSYEMACQDADAKLVPVR